jgi:hypothetical protein
MKATGPSLHHLLPKTEASRKWHLLGSPNLSTEPHSVPLLSTTASSPPGPHPGQMPGVFYAMLQDWTGGGGMLSVLFSRILEAEAFQSSH